MRTQVEAQNDLLNEVREVSKWIKVAIFMGAWYSVLLGVVFVLINLPYLKQFIETH